MARRKRGGGGEDGGGGANWMDTYGDLVTLLLCFFVLLFSFSSVSAEKWEALVGALSGTSVMEAAPPLQAPELEFLDETKVSQMDEEDRIFAEANISALANTIGGFIEENGIGVDMSVNLDDYTVTMHFSDNIFFRSGDAELMPESLPILDGVVDLLAAGSDMLSMINIEGHTDNVPIHTAKYPSNWELSTGRAVNTLHYIADTGRFDMDTFSVAGYAEYHPIASNQTEEGRAANRRVDFVIEAKTHLPENS
ncbi:MAG: OmpA family protein [Clostridiales Family XIII bacterium]|jgi:chemotaxis protein MotB|nr:OmpA family protein [Clostridiales Family XIII bacterium]